MLLWKQLQHKLFLMYSRTVAVEGNRIKPFTHAHARKGSSTVCSSKRLFLYLHSIRTPHDSSESAWTAWKKTPHTSTPLVQNVTSVDLATGKATGTSVVNKASCISEQIRQAHLGLFGFSMLIGVNE